jgi:iron complex transport system ATP-binding protein
MLEVRGLELALAGRKLVSGLSARFKPGEIWAILGKNGAGKTTLLHTLAGLRAPDGGEVWLDGRSLAGFSRRELARRRALLLQEEPENFFGTVFEWVRLARYPHAGPFPGAGEEARVRAALAEVGVAGLAARRLDTLSGGERQRVRLAMVLAQEAPVMLLDEPLRHLDLCAQFALLTRFSALARRQRRLLLMVLHDVYWASRFCDRTLLLFGDGRTEQGESTAVLNRDNIEALYGCPLEGVEGAGGRLFLPRGEAP